MSENRLKNLLLGPHGPYDFTGETAFLKKHGLTLYSAKTWEETYLGEVSFYDGKATAKIWVTCAPAKFYKFVVKDIEGRTWIISTGSGCITEYWPTVEKFAGAMIGVKQLQEEAP